MIGVYILPRRWKSHYRAHCRGEGVMKSREFTLETMHLQKFEENGVFLSYQAWDSRMAIWGGGTMLKYEGTKFIF